MKRMMIQRKRCLIILLFSVMVLVSCENQTEMVSEKDSQERLGNNKVEEFSSRFDVLIYLRDEGCITCNRKVVEGLKSIIKLPKVGVVVEGYGTRYDISYIIEEVPEDKKLMLNGASVNKNEWPEKNSFILDKTKPQKAKIIDVIPENLDKIEAAFELLTKNDS